MSNRTLTTLDFVINVLREHEKELTALSDKLEEMIDSNTGEGMDKNVGDIKSAIDELGQRMSALERNVMTLGSLSSSVEITFKQLMSQISVQNQNLTLLTEAMENYPTRKEVQELRESIMSFNSLIQELGSKRGDAETT